MAPTVLVVGLGPAGPDLLTEAAVAAIERVPTRFVRTRRHPSAPAVPGATSFDAVYDRAATLPEVYAEIVDALVEAAVEEGTVLYAVPGSPLVAERSVELLLADDRVAVEVVAGLSFLDLAWVRLGVDPIAGGVRVVDGRRFAVEAASDRGPLLIAQCDSRAVLSDIKLAVEGEAPAEGAVVLHHLGLPDESVRHVAWPELDRDVHPDHLTSVFVPVLGTPVGAEVVRFAELVRTLRAKCPWDREQTHQSLSRHLVEETYEVLDAIDGGDPAHLEEELGDLLFQVVFHATLAAEDGEFTLADVARGVHDKLVGRHPHVFGDVQADTAGQVMRNWEHIKQAEKGTASLMEGIPSQLPSLLYAHKVQRKAAAVGIEVPPLPPDAGGADGDSDIGASLFALVAAARREGTDPESALRATAIRFRDRFVVFERLAADAGVELRSAPPAAVAGLWAEAALQVHAGDGGRGDGGGEAERHEDGAEPADPRR